MYGVVKQHLQATLDEIQEAGLFKNERVIESPQDATERPYGYQPLWRLN